MSTDPVDDFGATLRRAREASGRTLRDLADTTKLGVRTLEALERNQTERLPPGIFRRSVVRAYAREVGLDPEQTLRTFLARYPDHLPPPGVTTGPLADVAMRPSSWSWVRLAGVIAVIVLVLATACWVTRTPTVAQEGRPGESTRTAGHAGPRRG